MHCTTARKKEEEKQSQQRKMSFIDYNELQAKPIISKYFSTLRELEQICFTEINAIYADEQYERQSMLQELYDNNAERVNAYYNSWSRAIQEQATPEGRMQMIKAYVEQTKRTDVLKLVHSTGTAVSNKRFDDGFERAIEKVDEEIPDPKGVRRSAKRKREDPSTTSKSTQTDTPTKLIVYLHGRRHSNNYYLCSIEQHIDEDTTEDSDDSDATSMLECDILYPDA